MIASLLKQFFIVAILATIFITLTAVSMIEQVKTMQAKQAAKIAALTAQ